MFAQEWKGDTDVTPAAVDRKHRLVRSGHFLRHLVEMVIAMFVGMAIFGAIRALLDPTGFAELMREHLDARYLSMTTFMLVPMIRRATSASLKREA